jgi:hypothetical protein
VGCYVLTGDIANKSLLSEWIRIKDKAGFSPLSGAAESFCAEKQPKFERHIEPGNPMFVRLDPGDVVDTPATRSNQGRNLVDPGLARVIDLKRRTRGEVTDEHNKHNSIE